MQNENTRSRHFDLLERAGHQPQKYNVFLMQLTLVVLWRKMKAPGYHHYTVNVWHFCVHSSGKIRERSLDINLSAGTHGAVPHYFGIPRKLRPNCIMMLVNIKTGFYLNCSKCCLYKWSGFSIGYPMTRYGTLRQAIQPRWLAQIVFRRQFQILRDAINPVMFSFRSYTARDLESYLSDIRLMTKLLSGIAVH